MIGSRPIVLLAAVVGIISACRQAVLRQDRVSGAAVPVGIYTALIDSLCPPTTTLPLVVPDSALLPHVRAVSGLERTIRFYAEQSSAAQATNFPAIYAQPAPLPPRLGEVASRVQLRSFAEIRAMLEKGYFPNMILFSRVGLAPDGSSAFVYVETACSGRIAGYAAVLVPGRGHAWRIERLDRGWIS